MQLTHRFRATGLLDTFGFLIASLGFVEIFLHGDSNTNQNREYTLFFVYAVYINIYVCSILDEY